MTYKQTPCEICGKPLTTAHAARYQHLNTHYINNECNKHKTPAGWKFYNKEMLPQHPTWPEYPVPPQDQTRWRFPPVPVQPIDPAAYFQPGTDPIEQAEKLLADLTKQAGIACKLRNDLKKLREIEKADWLEVSGGILRIAYRRNIPDEDET